MTPHPLIPILFRHKPIYTPVEPHAEPIIRITAEIVLDEIKRLGGVATSRDVAVELDFEYNKSYRDRINFQIAKLSEQGKIVAIGKQKKDAKGTKPTIWEAI